MKNKAFLFVIFIVGFYSCKSDLHPIPAKNNNHNNNKIIQILAGAGNSFFLKHNGDLYAVGKNSSGQLGNNTIVDIAMPTKIMSDVKAIAGGYDHAVILKNDGSAWSVGSNNVGQLGNNTNISSLVPIKVMEHVKAISAGGSSSFFVTDSGKMWATGANEYGQLGIPEDIFNKKVPVLISEDVKDVSNSRFHTIFLKNNGDVYKMGIDTTLDGVEENYHTYRRLSHPYVIEHSVRSLNTSTLATMMIKTDNTLWVRGSYSNGALGLGPNYNDTKVSTQVISNVLNASLALFHCLVMKSDSTIWISGKNNFGQFGSANPVSTNVFIASEIGKVSMISAGTTHSIFVKDGKIWGAGDNSTHQISPNAEQTITQPVLIELPD
jgi:alpha-tubulin suppressor-like RCC1 family protein